MGIPSKTSWIDRVRLLHCTLSLVAQCIVIGPVCLQWAGG